MIRNIISETKQLWIFREVVVLPQPPVADTVAVSGFLGQHNIALYLCNDRLFSGFSSNLVEEYYFDMSVRTIDFTSSAYAKTKSFKAKENTTSASKIKEKRTAENQLSGVKSSWTPLKQDLNEKVCFPNTLFPLVLYLQINAKTINFSALWWKERTCQQLGEFKFMLHLQTRLYRTPRAHQYHCYVNIILSACYSSKTHLHKAKCINLLMAPYFKDSLSKEIPFI